MIVRFRVTGLNELINRLMGIQTKVPGDITLKALNDLHAKFQDTFKAQFGTPGSGHRYKGDYYAKLTSKVTPTSLQEIEGNTKEGSFIRHGTRRQASFPPNPPYGAIEWAMSKLGVPRFEAFVIATAIAREGIGHGTSPLRSDYPAGRPYFSFPEWMVKIKNKGDIDRAAETMGTLIVEYLK